jgi:hypothetical protein
MDIWGGVDSLRQFNLGEAVGICDDKRLSTWSPIDQRTVRFIFDHCCDGHTGTSDHVSERASLRERM